MEKQDQFWIISHIEAIPLAVSLRAERLSLNEDKNPSSLFSLLKIHISNEDDNWEKCNFRNSHFFDESMLEYFSESGGLELQISKVLRLAKDSNQYLQTITTEQFTNWPYLFCAQLQILCEGLQITPYEVLYMFGIAFVGEETDSWDNFQWKYLLKADSIVVSLHSKLNTYEN